MNKPVQRMTLQELSESIPPSVMDEILYIWETKDPDHFKTGMVMLIARLIHEQISLNEDLNKLKELL